MKFWRRRKPEIVIKRVSIPILVRQAIYDSMLNPAEEIASILGLPPISDEVAEMEERASEERISAISSLIPFIDSHADIAARISAAAYMIEDGDSRDSSSREVEEMTRLFRIVSLSSTLSCISTLFSLDLLTSKAVHDDE